MTTIPCFLLIAQLALLPTSFAATEKKSDSSSSATSSFEALSPLLFQVKTSAGATAEKSSYGTGFVVGLNGFLLTNYHVVASAVWRSHSEQVFVVVNQESVPATLVDVDVVHDLALIQIPMTFHRVISLASAEPRPGANLHSLGLPEDLDWTVVNGVYNGLIKRGPYELLHMTSPINPGMSGGPTVNTKSELVGVNVSILLQSQNVSFAVPLKFALPLIRQAQMAGENKKLGKSTDELIQSIHAQLRSVQNQLTELSLKAFETSKTLENWQIPKLSNEMKCWGDKSRESERKVTRNLERCEIEHRTQLTHEISTAFVKIESTVIENHELNFFSYFNLLNNVWDNDEMDPQQFFSTDIKVNYGPYECHRSTVLTPREVQINVCARPLIPFVDLFEFHVKAIERIGTKQALMSYMILDGFNKTNFLKVLTKYLQNFGSPKP